MQAKKMLLLSVGGLTLYGTLALIFLILKDRDHALMFLVGALIWVGSVFIWNKNVEDGT